MKKAAVTRRLRDGASEGNEVKKHPEIITTQWLRRHHACDQAIRDFGLLFPKGARITLANLRKFDEYTSVPFVCGWLCNRLLNDSESDAYLDSLLPPLEAFYAIYRAAKKKAKAK